MRIMSGKICFEFQDRPDREDMLNERAPLANQLCPIISLLFQHIKARD